MKAHISHMGHFHINCLWRHHDTWGLQAPAIFAATLGQELPATSDESLSRAVQEEDIDNLTAASDVFMSSLSAGHGTVTALITHISVVTKFPITSVAVLCTCQLVIIYAGLHDWRIMCVVDPLAFEWHRASVPPSCAPATCAGPTTRSGSLCKVPSLRRFAGVCCNALSCAHTFCAVAFWSPGKRWRMA